MHPNHTRRRNGISLAFQIPLLPSLAPTCTLPPPTKATSAPAFHVARTALLTLAATISLNAPLPPAHAAPPPPPAVTQSKPLLLDLEKVLTPGQAKRLDARLRALDAMGIRIRILTQGALTAPGIRVRDMLSLDDETGLIIVDRRGGNVLNFRVGDALRKSFPGSFWAELANRFGNEFYIRDNGIDGALFAAIEKIEGCGMAGCRVVPGVSTDQLYISLGCAAVAGCVAGAASRTGGSGGGKKIVNWEYVALFSPLWGIFLVSFGIGPVVTRDGYAELAGVISVFVACVIGVWAWIPARFGEPGEG